MHGVECFTLDYNLERTNVFIDTREAFDDIAQAFYSTKLSEALILQKKHKRIEKGQVRIRYLKQEAE